MRRPRFDRVGVVIEFAVQSGVHAGQVIAFEVIVDICFPVALHLVGTALEKLHVR